MGEGQVEGLIIDPCTAGIYAGSTRMKVNDNVGTISHNQQRELYMGDRQLKWSFREILTYDFYLGNGKSRRLNEDSHHSLNLSSNIREVFQ